MRSRWIVAAIAVAGLGVSVARAGDELASVNGHAITRADFDAALENVPPQMQDRFAGPEGKQQLLDTLVTQEVLYQEAQRVGLEKDPKAQSRFEEAKRQILIEELMQSLMSRETTDAKLKEYYRAHKADFRQVKASHILVDTEDKAKDVKKRLKGKADFAEIAKEVSIDPSAKQNGGDLGFFTKDQMVKPFADKAFAMKVGQISDPVKTNFGYHIIKVVEIKEAVPFEKLDPQAVSGIKRAVVNAQIATLRSNGKVVTNPDKLK